MSYERGFTTWLIWVGFSKPLLGLLIRLWVSWDPILCWVSIGHLHRGSSASYITLFFWDQHLPELFLLKSNDENMRGNT